MKDEFSIEVKNPQELAKVKEMFNDNSEEDLEGYEYSTDVHIVDGEFVGFGQVKGHHYNSLDEYLKEQEKEKAK